VGFVAAIVVGRLITTLLVGVTPSDRVTLIAVGFSLVGVALAASYLPARRAARVDPIAALRTEQDGGMTRRYCYQGEETLRCARSASRPGRVRSWGCWDRMVPAGARRPKCWSGGCVPRSDESRGTGEDIQPQLFEYQRYLEPFGLERRACAVSVNQDWCIARIATLCDSFATGKQTP
jgi:hypothetical protein